MNKKLFLGTVVTLLAIVGVVNAQPTMDGIIDPGEWDAYYLGTLVTGWGGGTSVDVYAYADDTYLYAAYVADKTQPGWATACVLNINGNFYYKTPTTISWPDEGYTILEMVYPRVMQTDGAGWSDIGTLSDNGIEYAYIDMYSVDNSDCAAGLTDNNVAEFKIPLSLVTYAGDNGQIGLSGQYWQYEFADSLYVTLPPPTRADILKGNGVPGKGIANAPGLQKGLPNDNFAKGTAK